MKTSFKVNKNFKLLASLVVLTSLSGCIAAAGVAGVQGVSSATQERTLGERLDDNSIALSINNKFIQKDKDLFASVATDVREGRVLLTGKVADPTTKKDAEEMVWKVEGVREVINEITVTNQETFGNYVNDAWISNQIRTRMLFTENVKSNNYGVQTVDGTVYLMGIAQSDKEMQTAIEIARRTKGVKKVVSHVITKDDPRRPIAPGANTQSDPATNNNKNLPL